MRLSTLKKTIALTFAFVLSTNALAQACSDNFIVTGNLITGTTYKSYVDLPTVSPEGAWQAAYTQIVKDGWKIERADKTALIINSQNVNATRPMPMNVVVEKQGDGSKVSITYYTPPAASSPQDVVRNGFCTILAAASKALNERLVSSQQPTTKGIQQEQGIGSMQQSTNNEHAKNGFACVAEICIGDGLPELRKINWETAVVNKGLSNERDVMKVKVETIDIKQIQANYKGDTLKIFPFLRYGGFDARSIPYLSQITASCNTFVYSSVGLIGYFKSANGNPTEVTIKLLASKDKPSQQFWTVASIYRTFPLAVSSQQKEEIRDQLASRYKIFPPGNLKNLIEIKYDSLRLSLLESKADPRLHPFCGGNKKISVD